MTELSGANQDESESARTNPAPKGGATGRSFIEERRRTQITDRTGSSHLSRPTPRASGGHGAERAEELFAVLELPQDSDKLVIEYSTGMPGVERQAGLRDLAGTGPEDAGRKRRPALPTGPTSERITGKPARTFAPSAQDHAANFR